VLTYDLGDAFKAKRVVARRVAQLGLVPQQAMQRGQRTFWFEPSGNGCRRRMPLLQGAAIRILAVAPLRRVAAPRHATPAARSHSQIIGQHAPLAHRNLRQGFTLLELLVVVVIAGITLGVVSLNAFRSDRQVMQNDAQRIALLLQLTREEAILRNRPTAFEADANGYRFLVREESGWQALTQDDMLRQREFKRTPMQLSMNPAPTEASAPDTLRITFGREPVDKPFALTMASGDSSVVIRADGIGHFAVE
jgi:general secretion pathway protein H